MLAIHVGFIAEHTDKEPRIRQCKDNYRGVTWGVAGVWHVPDIINCCSGMPIIGCVVGLSRR